MQESCSQQEVLVRSHIVFCKKSRRQDFIIGSLFVYVVGITTKEKSLVGKLILYSCDVKLGLVGISSILRVMRCYML